jgi:hypothetical protein
MYNVHVRLNFTIASFWISDHQTVLIYYVHKMAKYVIMYVTFWFICIFGMHVGVVL